MSGATESPARGIDAVEAIVVFALIMAYIWKFRAAHPLSWILPVALILASHVLHNERPAALGFHTGDFRICVRTFGAAVTGLTIIFWSAGLALGTIRQLSPVQMLESLAIYVPWGLFQQYLMNGYFLRRLEASLSRRTAGILTPALFSAAHLPNWFLMIVTLIGGYIAIWAYHRHRNLYFLGLAHATLGFVLFMVAPDSLSHHLRVGPGWFAYR